MEYDHPVNAVEKNEQTEGNPGFLCAPMLNKKDKSIIAQKNAATCRSLETLKIYAGNVSIGRRRSQ
jgi:hypothetical protein